MQVRNGPLIVPTYEYRCNACQNVSTHFARLSQKPKSIVCEHCGSHDTKPIVSLNSVQLSRLSKLERLDPKYDKMLDAAAAKNPLSDPHRYLPD